MPKKNIYEEIIRLYNNDIDNWRILMYNSMGLLMRKNPLLRHKNTTFTRDDILSEAFMLADTLLTRTDIDEKKKISKLWYLFNRGGGALYNKLNQYGSELYTIDDVRDSENWSYDMDVDMLEYVLVKNNIITPLESQILNYLWEGRWLYNIARTMNTTYYKVREIVDVLTIKIQRFMSKISEDEE